MTDENRLSDVRSILAHDLDRAIRALTPIARIHHETREIHWLRAGLTLRVTPHQALVIVENATPEIVAAVEASGRSFCVAR
jgi:hypothetical protein